MAETIANAEVLEKNIDAKTRDFVKSLNKETIDANTKKILELTAEVAALNNKLENLKETIPVIFKGLVDQPLSEFKRKVTKGDVIRFMKKMGWSE
jgi:ribosomal protein S21|tara:strand:- start:13 stop:297 length:285 start_codon:yes stop_codon:yes gene_type:complete